ncbi:MAG: SMP-30/gluconolactonase/LRE family protein [Chloroflexi bacterium]|nr:SMP-30/gluconolactonase/LRE family protein [Chloroflexota bacterium]
MTELADLFESLTPRLIATGFVFTEGPLWTDPGEGIEYLYVSDVDARIHYIVRLADPIDREVIREDSGGANGAVFDSAGRLVICEQDARRVVRYESDGTLTVLADRYNGKRLNRSNDIVLHPDGSLYFTDPDKKGLAEQDKELGFAGIYRLTSDGELTLLADDMNHPNGLAFSGDLSTLYVSNSRPDPHLHAYSVSPEGLLGDSRRVDEMPYGPAGEFDGVPDGLKLDSDGNIFSTGPGGIWVWDADENYIGLLKLPELPANLGWGGIDNKTMFVTARTSVYCLRMNTAGIPVQH